MFRKYPWVSFLSFLLILLLSACGSTEVAVTPTPLPTPSQETQTPTPSQAAPTPTFTPEPASTPTSKGWSYTLTDLGEGGGEIGVWYPVLLSDKILTLDGRAVDYPPGRLIGGTSIDAKGEYCQLFLTAEDYPDDTGHCAVLIDAAGDFPFPAWSGHDYDYLAPLSEGGFVAARYADGDYGRWYILSADGAVEKTLPDQLEYAGGQAYNGDWYSYNEGLCPRQDGANGRWGYVDGEGQWAIAPQWDEAGPFHHGQAIVSSKDQCGVIDTSGNLVMPLALRGELHQGNVSPGCDAPMRYRWEDWPCRNARDGWLDDRGNPVPGPTIGPDTGIHFYYQNGYFTNGETYYDLEGQPCSETFDWCGGLTADGRGFVGLSGRVYRIEFTPQCDKIFRVPISKRSNGADKGPADHTARRT